MYISATALLILGALSGAAYAYFLGFSAFKIAIWCCAGGFVGSAAGGIVFTFLYLTAEDKDGDGEEPPRPVPHPKDTKRLQPPVKGAQKEDKALPKCSTGPESDKMKIKRLEQEIRSIRNRSIKSRPIKNKGRI